MDDFIESIFETLTWQTGINRDSQNLISQVAFRKLKLLISDFLNCGFQVFRDCDLRFLISESWFQISDFQILISSFRVLIFELLSLISG